MDRQITHSVPLPEDFETKYLKPDDGPMVIRFGKYGDGSTAMQVFCAEGLAGTATVALPGKTPRPGNVFIKDWSENQGMKEALVKAGVIGVELFSHQAGFAEATEHELLIP